MNYHAAYMREWRKTHPLNADQRMKDTSRSYAGVYKRRGKLVPSPCEKCGGTEKIEMHHPDYANPLEVHWLCRPCHLNFHAEKDQDELQAWLRKTVTEIEARHTVSRGT